MDLVRWNAMSADEARSAFLRCCGSTCWAEAMTAGRPYGAPADVLVAAEAAEATLTRGDWLEAFAAHPKIGDVGSLRAKFASTASWSASEQQGMAEATDDVIAELADANRRYEERFGHIFIVCASGRSAEEMLGLLKQRLGNAPEVELAIAAEEQKKITRLRLEKS